MKRHEALQPLSRFHRSILFLALVAKPNAPQVKGYPTDHEGKVDYALAFYTHRLQAHFSLEEKEVFSKVRHASEQLEALVAELLAERDQLAGLFAKLRAERSQATLHAIGALLERHVRKEERQLFQLVQETCGEEFLGTLQL